MPEIERLHETRNMNLEKASITVIYKGKQAGKEKLEKAG
jgi:hypothetical protein